MKATHKVALVAYAVLVSLSSAGLPAMQPMSLETARQASPSAAASIHRRAAMDPTVPSANPDGSVTVVEYFDYQCPSCKAVHADVQSFIAANPDVRWVFKDWPILGPASRSAARAALAAKWQGRYREAQDALMRLRGRLDEQSIRAALAEAGIDLARLDADMTANGEEIDRLLRHADDEATAMGLAGTPGFLIDGAVFFGALDRERLERLLSEARASRG